MSDAVEITLPVQPPTIIRKESVAGPFNGPQFDAQRSMPENWKRGRGKFNATISTSPWLPKIAGVPVILDYPHGCFEQISTKLLGYSFLANLARVFARSTAARRGISGHARARHEAVCRFAAQRWNAAVLARRRHRERFRDLSGILGGERIRQCRVRSAGRSCATNSPAR